MIANTTKILWLPITLILVVAILWGSFKQGPLEGMAIKSMFYKKGAKLSIVARDFETAMQNAGHKWSVLIDPSVSDLAANSNFGGGGDANNFSHIIIKNYNVKSIVFKKHKLILYVQK